MITWSDYKKKPESFWRGKKVRTLREMRNGNYIIPSGFVLQITRKFMGFSLEGVDTCEKCGIGKRLHITRVEPTALELVEEASG